MAAPVPAIYASAVLIQMAGIGAGHDCMLLGASYTGWYYSNGAVC